MTMDGMGSGYINSYWVDEFIPYYITIVWVDLVTMTMIVWDQGADWSRIKEPIAGHYLGPSLYEGRSMADLLE